MIEYNKTEEEIIHRLRTWNHKKGLRKDGERELKKFFDSLSKEETEMRRNRALEKQLDNILARDKKRGLEQAKQTHTTKLLPNQYAIL